MLLNLIEVAMRSPLHQWRSSRFHRKYPHRRSLFRNDTLKTSLLCKSLEAHPSAIRILGFCNFKKSIYKIPSFSSLQERQVWDVEVALALGSGLKSIDSFRLYELSTIINKSLNQYYNLLIIY